ncbi:MAG TPA: hypothetical protein VMC42_02165 [Methanoregulaceae archaeon]|nr:hypothetical protein [Methanoregulaceae archaeon]
MLLKIVKVSDPGAKFPGIEMKFHPGYSWSDEVSGIAAAGMRKNRINENEMANRRLFNRNTPFSKWINVTGLDKYISGNIVCLAAADLLNVMRVRTSSETVLYQDQ